MNKKLVNVRLSKLKEINVCIDLFFYFIFCFRIKGEVGLTPGSNLAPKPSVDPFMSDEQRKRVSEVHCFYNMPQSSC